MQTGIHHDSKSLDECSFHRSQTNGNTSPLDNRSDASIVYELLSRSTWWPPVYRIGTTYDGYYSAPPPLLLSAWRKRYATQPVEVR